MALTWVLA
jgi:hypothetical protein